MDALADPVIPLVISSRCVGLIRALSQVKPHKTHPETYDNDHVVFSHVIDSLRYFYVNYRGAGAFSPPASRAAGRSTSF